MIKRRWRFTQIGSMGGGETNVLLDVRKLMSRREYPSFDFDLRHSNKLESERRVIIHSDG